MSETVNVKSKKKKWIKILILIIVLIIFIFVSLAVWLILSFKPSGRFEGMWDGGMTISGIENDATNYYKEIKGKTIGVIADIDEQSRSYGMLRIRNEGGLPFGEEAFPSSFKGNVLGVEDETFVLEAKRFVDHGTAYLDGKFTLKKLKSGIVITGSISLQRNTLNPNVFDFGMDISRPEETYIVDAGMIGKLDPQGKPEEYAEGFQADNKSIMAYAALANIGDGSEVVFKWKNALDDKDIFVDKYQLTDKAYAVSVLSIDAQPLAPGYYLVELYINGQTFPEYSIPYEIYNK